MDCNDSRPGAYFVTMVTQGRELSFGEVAGGEMRLNRYGDIVRRGWEDLPRHYPYAVMDAFICMPNHVHGIVILRDDEVDEYDGGRGGSVSGRGFMPIEITSGMHTTPETGQTRPYRPTRHGLPEIIRAFKSFSARRINVLRHSQGIPVWQRIYYEHIIRDNSEMDVIRRYILNNPLQWELDSENPLRINTSR